MMNEPMEADDDPFLDDSYAAAGHSTFAYGDPASLPGWLRGLYYVILCVLTGIAIIGTLLGAYCAASWIKGIGFISPASMIVPVVLLAAIVFFGAKYLVDRALFGPPPAPVEPATMPQAKRKKFRFGEKVCIVLFVVCLAGFVVWQAFPLLSQGRRKALVEQAVRQAILERGLQRPLEPIVEMTETEPGQWQGTARLGEFTYRVAAQQRGDKLDIRWW
jgi:hypothetical protein